ncbi:MAG: cyclic nucleotide-binding domain-containing protein [Bacteriovoracaceae bacterium]|nr:cyclic nucleotide-binding domain-containing protein [Bacteriovoracaceae bacterium]
MATKKIIQKDDILIREGEHSAAMYWVQSGQLEVLKRKGNEEVKLGFIYSGELVGEMSFLDGEPRSASVKAVTECELVEIPKDVFEKVFLSQPTWFQGLVKTLTERLRKTNAKIRV